jgi:hypothetical protein
MNDLEVCRTPNSEWKVGNTCKECVECYAQMEFGIDMEGAGDHGSTDQGSTDQGSKTCYDYGYRDAGDKTGTIECPTGTEARGQEDMHSPPEASDLESECCRTNCYNEMKKAGTTCPDGKVLRMDGHDPTMGDMRPMMEQCCQETCKGHFAKSEMAERPTGIDWSKTCQPDSEDEWSGCDSGGCKIKPEGCCGYASDWVNPCNDWYYENRWPRRTLVACKSAESRSTRRTKLAQKAPRPGGGMTSTTRMSRARRSWRSAAPRIATPR